jgi:hypothetical protein
MRSCTDKDEREIGYTCAPTTPSDRRLAQDEGRTKTMSIPDTLDTATSFASAQAEFDAAWSDPKHTQFELPSHDVNKILGERYSLKPAVHFTRTMLWDMEMKKAWDPATYISYVVSRSHSWGRHNLEPGCERFFRSSMQIGWIRPDRGQVLEDVFINRDTRRIFFLGRPEMTDEKGERIYASDYQPLFHVEHAAAGTEAAPLNVWRIVLLTDRNDQRYTEPFKRMAKDGLLPGFLEIYIQRDLGAALSHR